jgi:excisionase family DNA binding protein
MNGSTQETIPVLALTPRQAARALNVCEKTLYNLTRAGEIPVLRVGRLVRYDPEDLRRWIRSRTERKSENSQNET